MFMGSGLFAPRSPGMTRGEPNRPPASAAPKPLASVRAVAGVLPFAEELRVGHHGCARMGAAHVLDVALVIREAHHQAGPLANALGEFGQPVATGGSVHAALTASPPRRP